MLVNQLNFVYGNLSQKILTKNHFSTLVKLYFHPASDFARVGAAVHRVFGEDFQDFANRLLDQDDVKIPNMMEVSGLTTTSRVFFYQLQPVIGVRNVSEWTIMIRICTCM